ncbi:hypothetical protein BH11ACT8_BH11ACT8_32720 [soil metagenome]
MPLLIAVTCVLAVTGVAALAGEAEPRPHLVTPAATVDGGPREVLRDWDTRRARAWADADPDELAGIYTPGSVAGRRDVRLLHRWSARSVRVTRLEPQVLALTVLRSQEDRIVLRVTDRIGVLQADLRGRDVPLPSDTASTRRLVLCRGSDRVWRMASVVEEPQSVLNPVASSEASVGSRNS